MKHVDVRGHTHEEHREREKTPPRIAPRLEGKVKNVGIKPRRKPRQK